MRTSGMAVTVVAVLLFFAAGCPRSPAAAPPAPASTEASTPDLREALGIEKSPPPLPKLPVLPPRPEAAVPRPPVDERDSRIEAAMALRHTPRAEEGIALLEKVRDEALEQPQPEVAAWALHRLGDSLASLGRQEEAREAYEKALAEHQASGDLALAGRAANDLGLLTDRGTSSSPSEMALSARWYARATELYQRSGDQHGLRLALNNQARMHLWRANFGPAVEIWNSAAILARRLGDAESERRVHANLALAWLLLAEGGFGRNKDIVVDPEAEAMARQHFLLALEGARLAGESAASICQAWGSWQNRCDRITQALARAPLEAGPPDPTRIRGRVIEGFFETAASTVEAYREAVPFSLEGLACAKGTPATHEDIRACACGEERAELARRVRATRPGLLKSSARIQADGSFELEGLVPGERYRLVASGESWRAERPEVEAGAQQIELGDQRHREVFGQVLDARGAPLPGATVLLADTRRGQWVQVQTDEDGEFGLAMAHTPVLALTAGPEDQLAFSVTEAFRSANLHRFAPAPHSLSLALPREVELHLRAGKQPLSRTPLTVAGGGCSLSLSTDDAGRLSFTLPANEVQLLADSETHYLDTTVTLPRRRKPPPVRVEATPYALIRGQVVDEQGQPRSGLKLDNRVEKPVRYMHQTEPHRKGFEPALTTDAEGRFLARYKEADTYCLYPIDRAWALPGYAPLCQEVAEGERYSLKMVVIPWKPPAQPPEAP